MKKSKGAGRPSFEPTAEQRRAVRKAAAAGVSLTKIAELIGISQPTLKKRFTAELAKRPAEAPEYKPTKADRERVAVSIGGGMSVSEIGIAMGLSHYLLKKHFPEELAQGGLSRRMDVLTAMYKGAVKGNTSAQRAYLSTSLAQGEAPPVKEKPKAAAPAPKLGKKELADAEAEDASAGTDWADLIPPVGPVLTH